MEVVQNRWKEPYLREEKQDALKFHKKLPLYKPSSLVVDSNVLAKELGYDVYPDDILDRTDIVQAIGFGNRELMVGFCQNIQKYSPVDSFVKPVPWMMPGYTDEVIMAAGTFTQGSSIELSCDGPLREPYIAFFQGGLFFDHARYALINAFKDLKKEV